MTSINLDFPATGGYLSLNHFSAADVFVIRLSFWYTEAFMNTGLKLTLAVLVVASVCSLGGAFAPPASSDEQKSGEAATVGQKAPDFTLKDSNDKTHSLSQYKGKFVVLEWVNFGCPFVRKHYDSGNMQKLQKTYTGKGVIWLSICSSASGKQGNLSPVEINKTIKERGSAQTAYLIDSDGKVGRMYGAKTTPDMFVIDRQGDLVYAGAIDDKVSTDVDDVPGAKNYVIAALDEAMNGKAVQIASTKSYGCSVKY